MGARSVTVAAKVAPTLCAEDDNVTVTFTGSKIRHFQVAARPSPVLNTIVVDSRAPDFTDCTIQDQPPGPEDKIERIVLYEDDTSMLVGYRHSEFWRKGDVPVAVKDKEERALHLVQLFTKTPKGPYEYLVLYPLDGYWRLRTLAPQRLDEVAYGTSFLVGPIEGDRKRPHVELKSIRYVPDVKRFDLVFAGKESAGTVRVAGIDEKEARVEVTLEDGVRGGPFAALRSMYLTEANADAAHVAWKERRAKEWRTRALPEFRRASATSFRLGRIVPSRHNTSAPDTIVEDFAEE